MLVALRTLSLIALGGWPSVAHASPDGGTSEDAPRTLTKPAGPVELGDAELNQPRPNDPIDEAFEREPSLAQQKIDGAYRNRSSDGWTEGAVPRFVGAFLGGAVGLALPLMLGQLDRLPSCASATCLGSWGTFLSLLSPLISGVGSVVGYQLAGGRPSIGAAVAGSAIGLGIGLMALLAVAGPTVNATSAIVPATALTIGIVAAAQAWALELRSDAVERQPMLAVPWNRFFSSSLGTLGAIILGGLAFAASVGFGFAGSLATLLIVGGAVPLMPYFIHQRLGGRGSIGAAYLGFLGALTAAGLGVLFAGLGSSASFFGDTRAIGLFAGGVGLAALGATFGVPVALEISHGASVTSPLGKNEDPVENQFALMPFASPVQGGAMAGAVVRF